MSSIVVFGENLNDSRALKELIIHICPGLSDRDVVVLREPPTLQRGAATTKVKKWVDRALAAIYASRSVRGDPTCVLVHTDSDGPGGVAFARERTLELRRAGLTEAHAVVPTEAIEAWWLLHPMATEGIVRSWQGALRSTPGDVDRVRNPKAELVRRTRRKQPKRSYEERDSADIAARIRATSAEPAGVSKSWEEFRSVVSTCCAKV